MRKLVFILLYVLFVTGCATKSNPTLDGTWIRKGFLDINDQLRDEDIYKYTFYNSGKYKYVALNDDVEMIIEGAYKVFAPPDSASNKLLVLVPPIALDQNGDTITSYQVYDIGKLTVDHLVLVHESKIYKQ
jgi:hypothetical protein